MTPHKSTHKSTRKVRTNAQGRHTLQARTNALSERGACVCAPASAQLCSPQAGPRYAVMPVPGHVEGWRNFRMLVAIGGRVRISSLAWNGTRLARSKELTAAAHRSPHALEALCEWLEAGQP